MLKEDARKLQEDYIPDGNSVSRDVASKLEFRQTLPHEIFQCGARTNYDPQSGPIYCGRIAEWVADVEDGMVLAICGKRGHTPERIKRSA